MFFNVLLLTVLNKNEFDVILEDFTQYLPLYNCVSRTNSTIQTEDFIDKDLILFGIGDGCFNIKPYINNLIAANQAGTPVGFTHGTPMVDPLFEDNEDESARVDYNNFLKFFGIADFLNIKYNFYNNVAIKEEYLDHDIFYGPMPLGISNISNNIPILETHDLGYILDDNFSILLNNSSKPDSRSNYYLATWEPPNNRGRIAHVNIGHNYYSGDVFYKPSGIEELLLVNTCSWLLKLNPEPL